MTETQEQVDPSASSGQALGVQLAERLWVPCDYVEIIHGFEAICINGKVSFDGQGHIPHIQCGGTGKVYSLQEPCYIRVMTPRDAKYGFGEKVHPSGCSRCGSRGWTSNTNYDALLAAVRAKGWSLFVTTCPEWEGDRIAVLDGKNTLSDVFTFDKLRGTEAILTALVQALDKVGA